MVNRIYELPAVISISGLTPAMGQVILPRARLDWIALTFNYTVTDTSISAGENIRGLIKRLYAGEGTYEVFHIETDEMGSFLDLTHKGIKTAVLQDADPTTATAQTAMFLIEGPFQLSNLGTPTLTLETRAPTDEWGTASAFVAEVAVSVCYSPSDQQSLPGCVITRESRTTSTRHEINPGPGILTDVLIKGATSAYLKQITLFDAGPNGVDPTKKAIDIKNWRTPKLIADTFNDASVAGEFMVSALQVPYYPDRRLIIENSTTDTCLFFGRNIVR